MNGQGRIRALNHTALLKWVLRHPFITTAIPGYTTFDQMEAGRLGRAYLEYTAAERASWRARRHRLAVFCVQCGSAAASARAAWTCPR